VLNRDDLKLTKLPSKHPTHPGFYKLTYKEGMTKTDRKGFSSATRQKARVDPVVLMDPAEPDKETHLVGVFFMYAAHRPEQQRPDKPLCDKLMLQPSLNVKVWCCW
jgi:hypothetical protein